MCVYTYIYIYRIWYISRSLGRSVARSLGHFSLWTLELYEKSEFVYNYSLGDVCDVCNVCDVCEDTTCVGHIFIKHLTKSCSEFSIYLQILFQFQFIIIQNPTQICPGGILERSWMHLGAALETFSILDPYFWWLWKGFVTNLAPFWLPKQYFVTNLEPFWLLKHTSKSEIMFFLIKTFFFIVFGLHFGECRNLKS